MGPGLARCRVAGPLGDGALARMTGLIKATPRVLPLAIGMLLVGGGIAGSARVSPVTLPSQADCFGDRAVASMSLRVVASRARAGVGICQEEPRKERQQGNDETRGPTRGRSLCIHVAVEALVGPSCILSCAYRQPPIANLRAAPAPQQDLKPETLKPAKPVHDRRLGNPGCMMSRGGCLKAS